MSKYNKKNLTIDEAEASWQEHLRNKENDEVNRLKVEAQQQVDYIKKVLTTPDMYKFKYKVRLLRQAMKTNWLTNALLQDETIVGWLTKNAKRAMKVIDDDVETLRGKWEN